MVAPLGGGTRLGPRERPSGPATPRGFPSLGLQPTGRREPFSLGRKEEGPLWESFAGQ